MERQLKVLKSDGSIEEYLHTKVIGTISSAMAGVGEPDTCVAEQLAEAITYFLYQKRKRRSITCSEILSMVKAVLSGTGHEEAAIALSEHHLHRRLRRSRVEVVSVNVLQLSDAELICEDHHIHKRSRWDKSRIVEGLISKYGLCPKIARTIASLVEEKILGMGINLVSDSLVKQLVLGDTAAILQANKELQTV